MSCIAFDLNLISSAYGIFYLGMIQTSEILKKVSGDLDVETLSIDSCSLSVVLRTVSIVADLKLSSSTESKVLRLCFVSFGS